MSGLPTINVVEDEQMSSEGSVNAPVAPPRSPSVHSARATSPIQPVDLASGRVSPVAKTLQSNIAGVRGSASVLSPLPASVLSPLPSTEVVGATTIPVDIPSREETQQAFAEVSSALRDVSSQHDEVRAGMQSLASGVETLRRARAVDVETTAQVQATLQRTLSTSSSLEARMEQAELSQAQAQSAAAEAHLASQRALQQAARLREEQTKTAQQLEESLSAQAQKAQTSIEGATRVALQTAKEVQTLSDTARKAEYTAQLTAAKVEEQVAQLEQRLQEQKDMTIREAQAAHEAQTKMMQQLEEAQKRAQATMGATQDYEAQIAAVSTQMKALEHLLVEQRMKGNSLENQLSAAQDRIGGAERRAQQLEEENRQIESELQYWNDYYAQEEEEQGTAEVQSSPVIGNLAAVPMPSSSIPIGESSAPNVPLSDSTTIIPPWPAPSMSSPSLGFGTTVLPPCLKKEFKLQDLSDLLMYHSARRVQKPLLSFHSSNRIAENHSDLLLLEAVLLEGMEVEMAVDYQVLLNK